jgi:nucleoside-diphosphate-sugar epimerase
MGPGKLPIDVWGGRHPDFLPRLLDGKPIIIPNDGRALLQPVFLDDLAEAFSLAMEQPHNSIGQVFNISSRYAITLSHYIEILRHELRSTSTVEYVPMEYIIRLFSGTPYLDVPGLRFICEHMCVDCKKADRVLGYRPTMTAEEAIRHTLKWFHETGNQKKVPALGSDRKSSPSG